MFKDNLKNFRESKNLSQATLADKVGITQAYISLLESGENTPNIKIAKRLADALEVQIDKLIS